ncbi:MAG: 4-amino-4-deoxy-L-arabinose transferase, partial [bacterium]|nr:4-amino-4-deoxy-L-arabinose transferase [bacterium]
MKKQKDIIELLIIIIVLAFGFFLYTFKLGEIPSGLYVDEASTGYNSYSILQTGKDEYGKSMPVAFRFLGSYTPPLYTYLSVPIIAVAGLNVTSVRFLSALCGVLNILIIFLLVKS